ncbi:MAG: hypothetical protein ABEI31_05945 [Halodesulfurarchaeum sp.]
MGTLGRLTTLLLERESTGVVYECRECGTEVSHPEATCPTCGSEHIASYDLRE